MQKQFFMGGLSKLFVAGAMALGANASAQLTTVFEEDFESYANNAALTTAWGTNTLNPGLTNTQARDTQSAGDSNTTAAALSTIIPGLDSSAEPIVVTYWFYDSNGPAAGPYGAPSLNGRAGLSFGVSSGNYIFLGAYHTESTSNYTARVVTGGSNWQVTSIPRTVGWHKMQIILDNGNVEFYVDDVLGATDTYSTLSGWGGFIRFGSPAGGPYMDAFYDDLTVQTGYAPIYSDDFGTDTSANYTVTESNNDATVVWAADYSASGLGPAPNTADGTTTGVRTAVNTAAGVREALSIISNQTFSGNYTAQIDYAWDFAPSSTTEYRIFGINHSGAYLPNYWQGGAPNPPIETDGYFSGATADGGATTDYFFYEGDSAAVDTGSPAGLVWADDLTADANRNNTDSFFATVFPPSGQIGEGTWNTVQMTYYNDNVYYFESGKLLAVYNDPDDTYTTGSVNFGHEDAFTSIGATNYIYWDNLQVLQVNAAPEASATTATLNFGSQVETSNTVLDTAIDSTGGIPVAITGVTITGTDAAAYAVTTQPASYPVYRANGSALNLQVTFTPPGADNYDDATLEVTTDDPGNPTISIDLQGSGLSSVNDWMLMDN